MNDDLAFVRRRAFELGLTLSEDDLAELARGWRGLQPQLERVRRGLARDDEPAHGPRFES